MKQLFLLLLLTPLFTPSAFLQKQQLDREAKSLKGNVKSVDSAISLIDKASGPESTRQRSSREEFDASGNLTVETRYDPFGSVLALLTYSDLDGDRVVKQEFKSKRGMVMRPNTPDNRSTRPPDPRYTAKLQYKYDSNGNRIESTQVFSDGRRPISTWNLIRWETGPSGWNRAEATHG